MFLLSVCRSPAAGGHVQLLVSRPAGSFWFLCHVWFWWAELSTGGEEEVDAIITTTRVRSGEDAGQAEVTYMRIKLFVYCPGIEGICCSFAVILKYSGTKIMTLFR